MHHCLILWLYRTSMMENHDHTLEALDRWPSVESDVSSAGGLLTLGRCLRSSHQYHSHIFVFSQNLEHHLMTKWQPSTSSGGSAVSELNRMACGRQDRVQVSSFEAKLLPSIQTFNTKKVQVWDLQAEFLRHCHHFLRVIVMQIVNKNDVANYSF